MKSREVLEAFEGISEVLLEVSDRLPEVSKVLRRASKAIRRNFKAVSRRFKVIQWFQEIPRGTREPKLLQGISGSSSEFHRLSGELQRRFKSQCIYDYDCTILFGLSLIPFIPEVRSMDNRHTS